MRSLGFNLAGEVNVIGTQFCCECNLCTMIACPRISIPRICTTNKRTLAKEGKKWETTANPIRPELHLGNRRVPIGRLIRKLGLFNFKNEGHLQEDSYAPAASVATAQSSMRAPPPRRP